MTATATDNRTEQTHGATQPQGMSRLKWALSDGVTVLTRNLLQLKHTPGQVIGGLMFPLASVVLFGFVFGSAIPIEDGANYREYLMPGLFVMGIATGLMGSMLAIARDNSLGVMDRFRSMPMARSAVLFGQTATDLVTAAATLAIMAVCGLLVGWRVHNGVGQTLGAFGLLLLLQYAVSWVGVYLGIIVKDIQVAARLGPLIMPVTMISNVFVPTGAMPAVLRVIADWNPVSGAVAACRQLFGNPGVPVGDVAWPMAHPVAATIGWSLVLLMIFVPLAIRRFQTAP